MTLQDYENLFIQNQKTLEVIFLACEYLDAGNYEKASEVLTKTLEEIKSKQNLENVTGSGFDSAN